MNEHPILFSGPMIRAILDNRKTQTRRVMRFQPSGGWEKDPWVDSEGYYCSGHSGSILANKSDLKFPYGRVGDRLLVRETHFLFGYWIKNGKTKSDRQKWRFDYNRESGVKFPDNPPVKQHIRTNKLDIGWFKRPSIHMPRWASRITLEITAIRVERLQEIREEDAMKEGVEETGEKKFHGNIWKPIFKSYNKDIICCSAAAAFETLWDSINAKRGFGWDMNPFVWVIEFRRIKK